VVVPSGQSFFFVFSLRQGRREKNKKNIFVSKGGYAMKVTDAAQILGLSGQVTPDDVKAAYREAARRYHPDVNPAGAEMMKLINAAYDVLKSYTGELGPVETEGGSYPEAVNDALNAIIALAGLEIEICGAWVWVGGQTFTHREALKTAHFRYASKKKRWYFRPEDWRSSSRGQYSMDDIREKYGSVKPARKERTLLDEEEAA
jgi:hypothetical protein